MAACRKLMTPALIEMDSERLRKAADHIVDEAQPLLLSPSCAYQKLQKQREFWTFGESRRIVAGMLNLVSSIVSMLAADSVLGRRWN